MTQLAEHFDSQRTRLVPQLRSIWDACEKNAERKELWFLEWQKQMQAAHHQLQKLYDSNQLRVPRRPAHEPNQLWYLYESYIHLTNNRLGLSRQDEMFVAYILQEALKHHG
jgi:hypothetical protein